MHGALRIALLAAIAAFVALPGGASARARQNNELTVEVTGSGVATTTDGFINCRAGGSNCTHTYGDEFVTLNAAPDNGSVFVGWDKDESDNCSGGSSCQVDMSGGDDTEQADFAASTAVALLSVHVTGTGGAVTSDPDAISSNTINCTATGGLCTQYEQKNDSITLIATAQTGSTFQGWTGACSGKTTTCTVQMTAATTVTATFAGGGTGSTFPLSVLVTGNGTVTSNPTGISCSANGGTCSQSFTANSIVTLTAAPASGATFQGWSGACLGTTTTCAVPMNAAKSANATFSGGTGGSTFPLTVAVTGNGTVSGGGISCSASGGTCTQNEAASSSVTLTATAGSGATFKGWSGSCSGTSTTCTLQMTTAKSVEATFSGSAGGPPPSATQTLTIVIDGHGTVADTAGSCTSNGVGASCTQVVPTGTALTLTQTSGTGAQFGGWSGACSGKASCRVTLSSARTVTANFTGGATSTLKLTSLGQPIVQPLGSDFLVTVRFSTSRRGTGRLRVLQQKRAIATITLNVHAGKVRFGPFLVKKQGQTQLVLTFTDVTGQRKTLQWSTCIGSCSGSTGGTPPPKKPKPPPKKPKPPAKPAGLQMTRGPATSTPTKTGASVTLHFTTNEQVTVLVAVLRNGKVVLKGLKFSFPAGPVALGPFAINAEGTYDFRLLGTDAKGRHARLAWRVVVPKR